MQELQEYREAIEFLAKKQENFAYDNKGANHAAIVLINMLKTTENDFLMFSGNFNTDVADQENFIDELQNYLESGKSFKLVLENDLESNESKALQMLRSMAKENNEIKITKAKTTFIEKIKKIFDGKILHFAVSDERSYRLEVGKEEYKAVCNFNDPEIAKELKKLINLNFE